MMSLPPAQVLAERLDPKTARVAIVGLGYLSLPIVTL
jgi:UDP-N-acetyl-D-mannosaminuronate dehydrogenase